MAHNRKERIGERRAFAMGLVRRILVRIRDGDLDAYEGYRQVQAIYLDQSGLLEEVKTFVDVPHINMSQEFRDRVVTGAKEWLERHPPAR